MHQQCIEGPWCGHSKMKSLCLEVVFTIFPTIFLSFHFRGLTCSSELPVRYRLLEVAPTGLPLV